MPYYGRGSGYLPDVGAGQQGNPFYNPYSATPDMWSGIAATLKNVIGLGELRNQQAMEQEQQALENEYRKAMTQKLLADTMTREAPLPQPGQDLLDDYQSVMGHSLLSVPRANWNTALAQYGAKKRAAPPKPPKTLKDIEDESAARARGAAAGKPPEETELKTYGKEVAGDEKRIGLSIKKYDTEINQLDTTIRIEEGKLEKARAEEDSAKIAFLSAKVEQLQKEKSNLLEVKAHLGRLGEQTGIGQRLSGKQRGQLASVLAGLDSAKQNPAFYRGPATGSPPAPPAGTPPGTKRQNNRTGETWEWNGTAWNRVG